MAAVAPRSTDLKPASAGRPCALARLHLHGRRSGAGLPRERFRDNAEVLVFDQRPNEESGLWS
ncbi:hypothetical protein [Paraburkholderia gardini]|uniref:hypothetical protein n=1 Tax=Paraburkholderia gardini TaxID=2823469 RepID=UPI001E5C708B|nr:hypothetical protein [Paraburkholderia gardini]